MSQLNANLLLLLAAALWGFGNVAQKTVLEDLDPFSAVGLRCLVGGLLVLPLLAWERGHVVARGFGRSAARVAGLFAAATLVQQTAYISASVTNASFLVNTAAVMTPVFAWLAFRERPSPTVWSSAGLTVIGALMLGGGLAGFGPGDLAAILSAALYAAWMVDLGRHMGAFGRPVRTACTQFFAAAAVALPVGAVFGSLTPAAVVAAGPELAVLGVGSTALAFGLQTLAQRYTPATHAAVIVSAEGVFGAVGAALFLGEVATPMQIGGAAIMLAAILHLALRTEQTRSASA